MRRHVGRVLALILSGHAVGCDLTDVQLVDIAEVVVAEAYVTVADTPMDSRLWVFVHGNTPGGRPSTATFDDAVVTVTEIGGAANVLSLSANSQCVSSRPEGAGGSCFASNVAVASGYMGGEALSIDVTLADGRTLTGSTRIPGTFLVDGVGTGCRLPPDTRLPLSWSPSDSAWAYLSEALILGLPDALAAEGIQAEDSLYLLGLSISQSDTTVVFPSEFGVFERFDLDQDLAVRLQQGLPEGASADVAITAVDRNYVNWVRGGSFNPSGAVRVSSLVGDGSGVFGSAVTRRFTVVSTADSTAEPPCPSS